MSKNQPINNAHSLCPQCLSFLNSASRKHPVEVQQCSGDVSPGNECKNKLQTHTQDSSYDTYLQHRIGWHTKQSGKGYCQRYGDFQGNDGHFIGDWLNIVYFNKTSPESLPAFRTNCLCMLGLFNCRTLFYSDLNFPQPFSTIRSLAMALTPPCVAESDHLRRRPVTRLVANQSECRGDPARVNQAYFIGGWRWIL